MRAGAAAGEVGGALGPGAGPGPGPAQVPAVSVGADAALAALYGAHYRALVRLAVLLVGDRATAEEVVQDSFAGLAAVVDREWPIGRALASLRASVVAGTRSAVRRGVPAWAALTSPPELPVGGHVEVGVLEGSAVVAAVRQLPGLQREVVALRCYCDLSDAQIAVAMGIGVRAVRRHGLRAMAALRPVLERRP